MNLMIGRVKRGEDGKSLVHVFDGSLSVVESDGSCGRWYAGGDERFEGTQLEGLELEPAVRTFYKSRIVLGPYGTLGGGELSKLYDELSISVGSSVATLATRRDYVRDGGKFLYLPKGMNKPSDITPELPWRILSIVNPTWVGVIHAAHMLDVPENVVDLNAAHARES